MCLNKTKLALLSCLLILSVSGCSRDSTNRQQAAESPENAMDLRLFSQDVTERDDLLRKGDARIEQELPRYRAQDTALPPGSMRGLSGPQLVQVQPNPAVPALRGGYAENVVSTAAMYFGTPYEYGSDRANPSSFDCSDFTRWAYLYALGMDLPKDSRSQAAYVRTYSSRSYTDITQARRGDLLFFISFRGTRPELYEGQDKSIPSISHVGIYLGEGKMIHTASAATGGVRIDPVIGNHLEWRFTMGGSVLEQQQL